MLRFFASILAIAATLVAAQVGYQTALLRVYREAEFYIDNEMLIVCIDGDYNETFYEIGFDREEYECRWNAELGR